MNNFNKITVPLIPQLIPDDQLLTNHQLAKLFDVDDRTPDAWRLRGDGPPFVRISARCIRYRMGDIRKWCNERLKNSTSES